jgi:hypothetical protein
MRILLPSFRDDEKPATILKEFRSTKLATFWVRILISRGFKVVNIVFVKKFWFWWGKIHSLV